MSAELPATLRRRDDETVLAAICKLRKVLATVRAADIENALADFLVVGRRLDRSLQRLRRADLIAHGTSGWVVVGSA